MERDFLRNLDLSALGEGVQLPKSVIDAIMAENGNDINGLRAQITTLTGERDDWKSRAETAEAIVQRIPKDQDPEKLLDALQAAQRQLEEAQNDFASRTAARDFDDALKKTLDGIKFTSEAARRDVENQVRAAGLTAKDGAILGLTDLLGQIREKDAAAFVDEKAAGQDGRKARFTGKEPHDAGSGGMTVEQIAGIKDRAQRRAAIAENLELFGGK